MDEYISRRELLARYDAEHEGTPGRARELIKQAPAADVAPVRHGRWLTTDAYPHHLYCSVCYKTYAKNVKWVEELDLPVNYCPECGALMDGKEDEDGQAPIKRSASDH